MHLLQLARCPPGRAAVAADSPGAACSGALAAELVLCARLPHAVLLQCGAPPGGDVTSHAVLCEAAPELLQLSVAAECVLSSLQHASASAALVQLASVAVGHLARASSTHQSLCTALTARLETLVTAGGAPAATAHVLRQLYAASASLASPPSTASSAPTSSAPPPLPPWATAPVAGSPSSPSLGVTCVRARALADVARAQPTPPARAAVAAFLAVLPDLVSASSAGACALADAAGAVAQLSAWDPAPLLDGGKKGGAMRVLVGGVKALTRALASSPSDAAAAAALTGLLRDVAAALAFARTAPSMEGASYRALCRVLVRPALLRLPLAVPGFFCTGPGSGAAEHEPIDGEAALASVLHHTRLKDVAAWGARLHSVLAASGSCAAGGAAAAASSLAEAEAEAGEGHDDGLTLLPANALAAACCLLQVAAHATEDAAIAVTGAAASAEAAAAPAGAGSLGGATAAPGAVVADGGYGLRDTSLAVVRSMLLALPFAGATGAHSEQPPTQQLRLLVAPALVLLRTVVGLPRLLPLRPEEVFACLTPLSALLAETASPAVRAARLALASRGHGGRGGPSEAAEREMRVLAVDLGRVPGDPALIVTCAGAAFPAAGDGVVASVEAAAHGAATLSASSSGTLAGIAWVLQALCRYRPDAALAAAPLVASQLQSLLLLALTPLPRQRRQPRGGAPSAAEYASPAALGAISRACEAFSRGLRVARYHAGAVVGAYVQLATVGRGVLAAGGSSDAVVGTGLPLAVRQGVEPGIMALLDVLDSAPKELQQLYTQLSHAPLARGALKQLHRTFEAEVKFTGKAQV